MAVPGALGLLRILRMQFDELAEQGPAHLLSPVCRQEHVRMGQRTAEKALISAGVSKLGPLTAK